jgi:uncharacterized protein YdcH (DUF465 family)
MFEYDEKIVGALLKESIEFKRLYDKHSRLKQEVSSANRGYTPIEDMELEGLKKEKLLLKDQMALIIDHYKGVHAA